MQRREFITLLGGAAAWPMAARGQTPDRIRRIGVLSAFAEDDPEERGNIAAFRQALEKLGWTNGGNVQIDYRWGGADPEAVVNLARSMPMHCRRDRACVCPAIRDGSGHYPQLHEPDPARQIDATADRRPAVLVPSHDRLLRLESPR